MSRYSYLVLIAKNCGNCSRLIDRNMNVCPYCGSTLSPVYDKQEKD